MDAAVGMVAPSLASVRGKKIKKAHHQHVPIASGPGRVLLDRDRLLALDQGLPVLVIEGPSGYGKTVLAEMWLGRQPDSRTRCWVSLDSSSRSPVQFIGQLLRAIGSNLPREPVDDSESGRAELFLNLSETLNESRGAFGIVLDDVHLLADSESRPYLERLLGLASQRLRLCLTTQPANLEVGLGHLTVQKQVTWIETENLKLTRDEVESFAQLCGQTLTPDQVDWLYGATAGWPALTQLALAMPLDAGPRTRSRLVSSGPLRGYISERFLNGLSRDEQDVLWMLCCIGSAPLALLIEIGPLPQKVEQALSRFRALGILQDRELDCGPVMALHTLIREEAGILLDRDRDRGRSRTELIRFAADWFWRNGFGPAALRLVLETGGAVAALARDYLRNLGFTFILSSGQHQQFLELAEQWEKVAGSFDPEIDEFAAWASIFLRRFPQAEVRLQRIEAQNPDAGPVSTMAYRAVLAALRGDLPHAGMLAKRWIEHNEDDRTFRKGLVLTVLACSQKRVGHINEAHAVLRDAMHCFDLEHAAYGTGWAHVINAIVMVQAGRYRMALAQVESGLLHCSHAHAFANLRVLLRAIEAFIRYERNEPDRVREILGEALPSLAEQGIADAVVLGYIAASRGRAAAFDFGTALDILSEGELVGIQKDLPRLTFSLRAERALMLARSGAFTQAQAIVDTFPANLVGTRTVGTLLRARLAMANGDGQRALREVMQILPTVRSLGRQGRLCETLAVLACAEEQCGHDAAAFQALAEALDIASVEGYFRSFLDDGSLLRALIVRWLKERTGGSAPAVVLAQRLVSSIGGSDDQKSATGSAIPLNRRERQLMAALNEGLSNAQLATRCFISEGTVKWYLHNLYEKFGVSSRTALLRAARDTGMIFQ